MTMANIGAAWIKKSKNSGKTYMSCVLEHPETKQKIYFAMFKNNKKDKETQPDYNFVWNEKKDNSNQAPVPDENPFNDEDIPL
jgi:uncharacterized protein (DUF736 family)